jgi:ketosteroid isomerase-like protein
MSVEDNKALVSHFLEAQAKGDLVALEELLAPDFVDHCVLPTAANRKPTLMRRASYDGIIAIGR